MDKIYFDYASTTPMDSRVYEAMRPYFGEKFGNASSPHSFGREAKAALEDSRVTVANFLHAAPEEIVFTSGATESNNQAVFGIARQLKHKGNHIIVSSIEHHSVLEPIERLKEDGYAITYLEVDGEGCVDPEDIQNAISDKTILISVMCASNEIGTIQPISEIGKIAKEHNIFFHVDAVQAVGHIPVNVNELGADLLSLSAHKFYGPKGMGALYVRRGIQISPFIMGGDQESARRASTQNVVGAVGLAQAIEICGHVMRDEIVLQTKYRDQVLEEIPRRVEGVKINGHLKKRLPNNAHFSFENVEGESLLMSLDMENMAASMGSACHSGAMEPSHVLMAIGLSEELAYGALRITIGRWTTQEHIDYLLEKLPGMIEGLRS
jgi:cysteine desulfurase